MPQLIKMVPASFLRAVIAPVHQIGNINKNTLKFTIC